MFRLFGFLVMFTLTAGGYMFVDYKMSARWAGREDAEGLTFSEYLSGLSGRLAGLGGASPAVSPVVMATAVGFLGFCLIFEGVRPPSAISIVEEVVAGGGLGVSGTISANPFDNNMFHTEKHKGKDHDNRKYQFVSGYERKNELSGPTPEGDFPERGECRYSGLYGARLGKSRFFGSGRQY